MKKSLLLLFITVQSLGVTAQANPPKDMDWRLDTEAYKSAKPMPLPSVDPIRAASSVKFGINPDYLKQKLSEFSGAAPTLIDGQQTRIKERGSNEGRKLALKFLKQEYEALGFTTSEESYDFASGTNFVAEKKGSDPSKVLIISSHIDSVHNAGANDDGSGTIAVLAIAKALSQHQFKYTLRVLGFDQEELGLVGSRNYASSLADSGTVIGDIQLDMVGTNSKGDGAFHVMDCKRSDSSFLKDLVLKEVASLELPLKFVSACTDRSDHASFWDNGIPAIAVSENFFGGDEDKCYHKKCDVVDDRIKFQYTSHIANAIASAASQILQME